MKMASTSAFTLFLLWCSVVASQDCDQFAATGRSFNVPLGYVLKNNDTLKWKFNDKTIFHKRNEAVITGKPEDINTNGSLKLTNVRKDQAGLYSVEVHDQSGKQQFNQKIALCVLDPVKKPKVEATCKDENVMIKCIPGQKPDPQFEWLKNGAKMEKETKLSFQVKAAETKADKFACNVSNKASFEVSEPVTHNCAKIGIPGLPDELWGISIWYFVGAGGAVVLLLILTVIICCVRTRRTRKLRLKDEEELRLGWTNTEQHNHHHHDHHLPPLPNHPPPHHPHNHHHHQQQQQQQQAPGNTGPRQSRSKQNRQPRPKAPEPSSQPQPSPRRALQVQKDADEEQPPPLPQPRKKGPKTQLN